MNESEFIELLNLYVDHEITSADAARLEAEVAANPARARVYRQYCGMQKACMILADQFREGAPVAAKIAAAAPAGRGWGAPFAAAGLVAAACVAAVLVARHPSVASQGTAAGQLARAEAPAVPASAAAVDSRAPALYAAGSPAAGADRIDAVALLAGSDQQDSFAWMNRVQLSPVQRVSLEPFLFDPKAALEPQGHAFDVSQPRQQGPAEMTAFKLQLDK
jgi:hypothetical protein